GSRVGPENARAAILLLLALPGPVFLFQGDELGMLDAPSEEPARDRAGRDAFRRPMPWTSSAKGGFTEGTPWLPVGDGVAASVEEQERDPQSHLALVRRLIEIRRSFGTGIEFRDSPPDTIVIARGEHVVAINLGAEPRPVPRAAELLVEANPGDSTDREVLPPHGGWIATSM